MKYETPELVALGRLRSMLFRTAAGKRCPGPTTVGATKIQLRYEDWE